MAEAEEKAKGACVQSNAECAVHDPAFWRESAKFQFAQQERMRSTQETWRSGMQENQNLLQRFLSYLTATGILADPNSFQASTGLDIARKHGLADVEECSVTMPSRCPSMPYITGDKEDVEKAVHEWAERDAKCVDGIPACHRSKRCRQVGDELPF
jgi:hypothetical protein